MIPKVNTKKFVVAVVLLAGVLAAGAIVGVATHTEDTTTDGFIAFAEDPETGEMGIAKPEEERAVKLYIVPGRFKKPDPTGEPYNVPGGVEFRADWAGVITPNPVSNCTVSDAKTAGFDRGNDDPDTITDGSLASNLKEQQFREVSPEKDPGPTAPDSYDKRYEVMLDLFGPNDFAGDPINVNTNGTEDEIVLALQPCVKMPDQEGWYRTWFYFNGTVTQVHDDQYADQFEEGQYVEAWEPSLWYPICECDVIRDLPMRLDPPPEGKGVVGDTDGSRFFPNGSLYVATGGVASDGTVDFQGTTVSADQVTSEGVQFEDGTMPLYGPVYFGDMQGSDGMIREDGTVVAADGTEYPPEDQGSTPDSGEGDATPTATSEGERTDDGTDGSTDDGTDGSSDDSTDGGIAETETDDGSGDMTTATDAPGDDGGEQTAEGQTTPTADDGTGFGVVAAALAALVVGLVAARRHRRR